MSEKLPKDMTDAELKEAALQLSEQVYNNTYEEEFEDSEFVKLAVLSHELFTVYNELLNRKSAREARNP